MQKINPKMLELLEIYLAFAFEVQHHKPDFIFFLLGTVVDNVCVLNIAYHFDVPLLG